MVREFAAMAVIAAFALQAQEQTPDRRLRASTDVFREIMKAPHKGIPEGLLRRAECVVIIPGLKKGAFVFGADYG
jgi:SH3 domain-containing YSC84-like protein 1